MGALHSLITGGAGFIGSNLALLLRTRGHRVTIVDNFCRGRRTYLGADDNAADFMVLNADLSVRDECRRAFAEASAVAPIGEVWHLAANSDIPAGIADPDIDFRDTFRTTFETLDAMRQHDVRVLHFASSSAIYGDLDEAILHEDIGPLMPISNYGAMKLASEAQASAAAESALDRVNIFRFPNVVGVPATHGVILDFVNKLIADPSRLVVLGDGSQQKAYLHVSDLIDAMLTIADRRCDAARVVVNIGPVDAGVTVRWIAEQVVVRVAPAATIVYGEGNKGWVGDVPRFNYSTARLQSYGWTPRRGSEEAIITAIDQIATQQGV